MSSSVSGGKTDGGVVSDGKTTGGVRSQTFVPCVAQAKLTPQALAPVGMPGNSTPVSAAGGARPVLRPHLRQSLRRSLALLTQRESLIVNELPAGLLGGARWAGLG